jgi:hypothetical protein
MGAFMSYVLVPQEHGVTRLLLKVVMQTAGWAARGLCIGDLIMARRQLLNLKQLSERNQPQVTASSALIPAPQRRTSTPLCSPNAAIVSQVGFESDHPAGGMRVRVPGLVLRRARSGREAG